MNYELAKELKEAGFPQQADKWYSHNGVEWVLGTDPVTTTENGFVVAPNLSELIEACGDEFGALSDHSGFLSTEGVKKKWCAHSRHHTSMGLGDTPEEAVARLWLALNKK